MLNNFFQMSRLPTRGPPARAARADIARRGGVSDGPARLTERGLRGSGTALTGR